MSDKGLNDRIGDKELVKSPAGSIIPGMDFREEMLAAREKERGGHQGTFFEQSPVKSNCVDNTVDDILRDNH